MPTFLRQNGKRQSTSSGSRAALEASERAYATIGPAEIRAKGSERLVSVASREWLRRVPRTAPGNAVRPQCWQES